jgi:ATP-binding cassette subfamily B protein
VFGTTLLVLGVAAELFPPLVWGYVVDDIIRTRQPARLIPPVALMSGVYLLNSVLSAVRTNVMEKVGQHLVYDLRNAAYDKLQAQSLQYFGDHRTGDLLSRLTSDIETVQDVVIRGTDSVIANFLRLVGVATVFVWLNWRLGIACLIPIVVLGFALRVFNRRVRGLYRLTRERLGDVSALLQDNVSGMRVIKAYAREPEEGESFRETSDQYRQAQVEAINARSLFFPTARYVASFGQVTMLGYGAYLIMQGQFTVGGLVTYRGYGRYFFGPIDDLTVINDTVQRGAAAWSRVLEVLDAQPTVLDRHGATALGHVEGHVRFENVTFGYRPDWPILTGISLDAAPGKRIAFVGDSGSGKTTALSLIPRFWDVWSGAVTVDGHDVRDVSQRSLRRAMAIVQQETFLFNDTVLNNIRYGRPDATQEEVERAATMANAHEFILGLPEGYETVVGERGVRLSGGQRQRISVARAFLADPRILLLDEATSSVEPESEWVIQNALDRLMAGRTTFIVSHRMSMVRDADEILVLNGGRIAERGTHDELVALGGQYARMLAMQVGG